MSPKFWLDSLKDHQKALLEFHGSGHKCLGTLSWKCITLARAHRTLVIHSEGENKVIQQKADQFIMKVARTVAKASPSDSLDTIVGMAVMISQKAAEVFEKHLEAA